MSYYTKGNLIIIRKHILLLLLRSLKVLMYLFVAGLLYRLTIKYKTQFGPGLIDYIILPTILLIINFSFLKLSLYVIQYYNNLLIFNNDHLVVIKSSFILVDDIELLDIHKVTKIDTFTRGITANIFGYGTVIVEQTRDEVRKFSYIPDSQKFIRLFREHKNKILEKKSNAKYNGEKAKYNIEENKDISYYDNSVGNIIRQIKRDTNNKI